MAGAGSRVSSRPPRGMAPTH
uniref:Uncharacterized protein n=1 Tax=Arundo donax TaxID=35708 RepID=A0A0A9HTS1_ARUDO